MSTSLKCHGQVPGFSFDLEKPQIIELPNKINQISGLAYWASDTAVLAIDDDHGNLYKIPLQKDPNIQQWKFSKDYDYEDVVLVDNIVYVLRSNGQIVYFPFSFPITETNTAEAPVKGSNEFESVHKNPLSDELILLCKDCKADKKEESSAYSFDLETKKFKQKPVYVVKKNEIEKKYGGKIKKFKPSATNINPVTGETYMLSSINHLLVVADAQMRIKTVGWLDPELFPQPEGLCFTPSGDMLISNEATEKQKANILIFRLKK